MRFIRVSQQFNPRTDEIESLFTNLTVKKSIGSGGQKIVYMAEHSDYGKVALKLIRPGSSDNKQRIEWEINTAKSLRGPGFSRIFDSGEKQIDGQQILYILEEYLEGKNLREVLEEVKKLGLPETLELAKCLLETLTVVHEQRIVHRDIKPENIFITKDNKIVLLDFGIARHLELSAITESSAFLGPLTPGYAAPEQIRNEIRKISSRTDIFQLGIVIYECLTGFNPFTQGTRDPAEALKKNLEFEPVALSEFGFSRRISVFVGTCFNKHVHRRYKDAREAKDIVENLLKGAM
jgi:serine/threonine protein kinase